MDSRGEKQNRMPRISMSSMLHHSNLAFIGEIGMPSSSFVAETMAQHELAPISFLTYLLQCRSSSERWKRHTGRTNFTKRTRRRWNSGDAPKSNDPAEVMR